MIVLEVIATIFVADFGSGLFHWLEDAYGREHWPLTGSLITKPNILHHHEPRYFTRHTWLHSSWLLLCIGALVLLIAWACGALTWHVWLFVILGANANQIHKWAHRTPAENGPVVAFLQKIRLVQTPRHHAHHHTDPKSSHYCVLTDFLNPILDAVGFWRSLESVIWAVSRVRRRLDTSVEGITLGTHSALNGSHRPELLARENIGRATPSAARAAKPNCRIGHDPRAFSCERRASS